jgi:hypothetical protein
VVEAAAVEAEVAAAGVAVVKAEEAAAVGGGPGKPRSGIRDSYDSDNFLTLDAGQRRLAPAGASFVHWA